MVNILLLSHVSLDQNAVKIRYIKFEFLVEKYDKIPYNYLNRRKHLIMIAMDATHMRGTKESKIRKGVVNMKLNPREREIL